MAIRSIPPWMAPIVQRGLHVAARFVRPLTLGVRAVILDEQGRVFLVRHSYVAGWHLPGGAVEPGETIDQAMRREVREEARIAVGTATLHGIFFNRSASNRDHVTVFVTHDFSVLEPVVAGWEIVEGGFFGSQALPDGTSRATRARLAEVLDGAPIADLW